MTPRVREILSWYGADSAGTLTNLSRLLSHGRLAGTGKLVILPVQDALRLGCWAVGFTIYPGSAHQLEMYGQLRTFAEEAKHNGLAVVIWSYPRGSGLMVDKGVVSRTT
jgi:DhnA family fructose-bisphosphate aldolase class Ia